MFLSILNESSGKIREEGKFMLNQELNYDHSHRLNYQTLVSPSNNAKDYRKGRWEESEHLKFIKALLIYGYNWKKIEEFVKLRSILQIKSHTKKFITSLANKFKLDEAKKLHKNITLNQIKKILLSLLRTKIFDKHVVTSSEEVEKIIFDKLKETLESNRFIKRESSKDGQNKGNDLAGDLFNGDFKVDFEKKIQSIFQNQNKEIFTTLLKSLSAQISSNVLTYSKDAATLNLNLNITLNLEDDSITPQLNSTLINYLSHQIPLIINPIVNMRDRVNFIFNNN